MTRSHVQAAETNAALSRILSEAREALRRMELSGVRLTADRIREAVEQSLAPEPDPQPERTFLAYARERVEHYDKTGTIRNHKSGLNKVERFLRERKGQSDVPLSPEHLTPALLEELMTWERTVLENKVNTVHKTMRTVRRFINMAIRDGHFPRDGYPFDGVELRRMRTEKKALRPEEVETLEKRLQAVEAGKAAYPEPGTLAHHVLRGFLFQIYMLGMRWGDLCTLRWESVGKERISYRMRKTGQVKDLRIVPKAASILKEYEERRGEKRFVFPFLDRYVSDPGYDMEREQDVDRAIDSRNARANQLLKIIAEKCEIDTRLTTHVARHSFAEAAMRAGWTLQEISTALGHKSIATTEGYIKSLRDDELDDKHEDLF